MANSIRKWLKNIWSYVGWDDYLAGFILLVGVLGFIDGPMPYVPGWDMFYEGIRYELIGIGVSVLIIANAGEVVSRGQEKKRLILQMGSPDNAFAVEAARQIRSKGWLVDGSLRGAYLIRANLSGARLTEANLSGAALIRADLRGANLYGANLTRAYLSFDNLSKANLRRANLTGAKLIRADLRGANLTGADLTETTLRGANLTETDLTETDLSGAKYNKETEWPDDFDPQAARAVLVDDQGNPVTDEQDV